MVPENLETGLTQQISGLFTGRRFSSAHFVSADRTVENIKSIKHLNI